MNLISFPFLIFWFAGAILTVVGFINLAGPRKPREAYARWEFPPRFYLVAAVQTHQVHDVDTLRAG